MKKIVIGILYFPLALAVSLIVGMLIGIIGKTVGNFQDMRRDILIEFRLSKRHPKKNNLRFMRKSISVAIENGESRREINRIESDFLSGKQKAFHPLACAFASVGFYFLLTPFSWLAGMIEGPERMFECCQEFWHKFIFREEYMPAYERYFRGTSIRPAQFNLRG